MRAGVFHLPPSNYHTGGGFLSLWDNTIIPLYGSILPGPSVFNFAKGRSNMMENSFHMADQFTYSTNLPD